MSQGNFLLELEKHQSEASRLYQTGSLPKGFNRFYYLLGLHFFKVALPVSFLATLLSYIFARDWIINLGKALLLL